MLFVAGAVLLERQGQEEALLRAQEQAETLAHSLAQHAGDTFQMADLALGSLSRLIGAEPPTRSKLASVRDDMRVLLARVPRLHSLDYYEESGWRLATSQPDGDQVVNQSRSTFFRFHLRNEKAGLYIGPPLREGEGPWLVTLSRRITKEDGSFNGVLVATIESKYFSDFYKSFDTGNDVRVALLGADGALLARNPDDPALIGHDMSGAPAFKEVQAGKTSGVLRIPSPIDAVARVVAFQVIEGQGNTIVFSLSREAALLPWRHGFYIRGAVFVLLSAFIILGGLRLARHSERRQASEKSLLQLSLTDSLTGLLNRRGFDRSMAQAWRHCTASGTPLSLLMIDVDCFKSFNDTYGHQAGDTCLQIVALSIRASVPFPEDRVARYGGEEIVVLLPETSAEEASIVAERIRAHISALNVQHAKSAAADHITVSIGCATERGGMDFRTAPGDLLADADRALYEAKLSGRDNVVSHEELEAGRPREATHLRLVTTGT